MITIRKRNVAFAVAGAAALALTLGAGGYATDSSGTAPVAAQEQDLDRAAPMRAVDTTDGEATAPGYTVVRFDEAAVAALAPLKPQGVAPGAFGLTASGLAVEAAFPVVAASDAVVDHAGGITFGDADAGLTLRGFRVDTATGSLTATAVLPGQSPTNVELLEIAPTAAAPGCDVSGDVTLAAPAATALDLVFGVGDLAGARIGTACVTLP